MSAYLLLHAASQMNSNRRGGYGGDSGGGFDSGCACQFAIGLVSLMVCLHIVIGLLCRPPLEHVKTDTAVVEIVQVDQPKFFSIQLRNEESGEVTEVILGGWYGDWRTDLKVGRRLTLTRETYKRGERYFYNWPDLREKLKENLIEIGACAPSSFSFLRVVTDNDSRRGL